MKRGIVIASLAGLVMYASPALANTVAPVNGTMLLSDTEMDKIVAGTEILLIHQLLTGGPDSQIIPLPENGATLLTSGEGPHNDGVLATQDVNVAPPVLPFLLLRDGTIVGQPSNGNGAEFIDLTFVIP